MENDNLKNKNNSSNNLQDYLENISYKLSKYHEYITSHENINSFIDLKSRKEDPVLIGYLNRIFGYNGFNKAVIGTKVYSFKDIYYFEIQSLTDDTIFKVKFYKETLEPCINFI